METHKDELRYNLGETIELTEIIRRLKRGSVKTVGFCLVGFAIAAILFGVGSLKSSTTITTRVVFAFPGYGKGQYPDGSKFQPDDLRAPDVIFEALTKLGINGGGDLQSEVRAGLTVEGIIPPNVIKERDRLRASGQPPPTYLPDEYVISLSIPRRSMLGVRQREILLNEIVNSFRNKFTRTYASLPNSFGNVFEALKDADYFEYEIVLKEEILNIERYLTMQLEDAKTFRSQTTNFTYNDLLQQTRLFAQIHLNETLGQILINGLSQNRDVAMLKMEYYLHTLDEAETRAVEDEKVVVDLLNRTQQKNQNYVMAVKSQAGQALQSRAETQVIDQTVIDALLANDSYNFLVRKALQAGLDVKKAQAEKDSLLKRKKSMQEFVNSAKAEQKETFADVQASLSKLEIRYRKLIENIRATHLDYAQHQFADAIRMSMEPQTDSFYHGLIKAALTGTAIGLALGAGLSLLGGSAPVLDTNKRIG